MLEPLNIIGGSTRQRGLTLIELLVGIAVIAVLVALAAPSFKRMIDTQRLRGVNAAYITDMQFARAEAVSRNAIVKVGFDKTGTALTCYVILTGDNTACDCRNAPGSACTGPGNIEIRTVQVDRSLNITLGTPEGEPISAIGFDPATGRLLVIALDIPAPADMPFPIEVKNSEIGGFLDTLALTGRPTVCSPGSQISGVTPCP